MRGTTTMTKFGQLTVQVWILPTSLNPLFLPHLAHYTLIMSLVLTNNLSPPIDLILIITPLFSSIHIFFLIKDQVMKRVLLRGPCRGDLYPLPSLHVPTQKLLLLVIQPSSQRWHCRLGHPFCDVVLCVIKNNNLSCIGLAHQESVCDASHHAKAHQLPYPKSTSQSSAPLELISPDV
jgi:hypothetical protein